MLTAIVILVAAAMLSETESLGCPPILASNSRFTDRRCRSLLNGQCSMLRMGILDKIGNIFLETQSETDDTKNDLDPQKKLMSMDNLANGTTGDISLAHNSLNRFLLNNLFFHIVFLFDLLFEIKFRC